MNDVTHLDMALRAHRWLDSVTVSVDHHLAWPVAPDDEDDVSYDLYHGTPGVILFCLELHHVTGEQRFLELAGRGAETIRQQLVAGSLGTDHGLYTGRAGHAWTFIELAHVTRDERHRDVADRCIDQIIAGVPTPEQPDATAWQGCTDIISGAAGAGLCLLHAHERLNRADALTAAANIGTHLLELANEDRSKDDQPTMWWRMTPEFPRIMPNFSHGTAGIGHFLSRLTQRLPTKHPHRSGFANAAIAGARHLLDIADIADDRCLIHHHTPDGEQLFYLGWCHGPAGTGRYFEQLTMQTGDETWRDHASRGARAIVASGVPEQQAPGFWNNVGVCCGAAGVAWWLRESSMRSDPKIATLIESLDRHIIRKATTTRTAEDDPAVKWIHAEHRVRPERLAAQTGFMQGAAGIGLYHLRAHHDRSNTSMRTEVPLG